MTNMMRATFVRRSFLAISCMAISILLPIVAHAQPTENITKAMALLKAETAKLGQPAIKGEDPVSGKTVPGLFFGQTKMNNNFALVDQVQQAMGGTATPREEPRAPGLTPGTPIAMCKKPMRAKYAWASAEVQSKLN